MSSRPQPSKITLTIDRKVVLRFKHPDRMYEFAYLHPKVYVVVEVLCFMLYHYGLRPEVTSMVRPHFGDSGVHATGRAIDIVARKGTAIPKRDSMKKIAAIICRMFPRPDSHPTCMYHDTGSGIHFHIQVPWSADYQDLHGVVDRVIEDDEAA